MTLKNEEVYALTLFNEPVHSSTPYQKDLNWPCKKVNKLQN